MTGARRIRVGISSCLVGEAVRYNGAHKRDDYITDVLSKHFVFVPYCPEVAIGLGVPRATIRLERTAAGIRAIQPAEDNLDVTARLADYGRRVAAEADTLCGYIFKSRSPSCGTARVKVYRDGQPAGTSPGVYAREILAGRPLLPVEEEGRLNDPSLRDNFIERVLVYHRWLLLESAGVSAASLVRFHTEHKFLILAHSQAALRELGRMVADPGANPAGCADAYIRRLMSALSRPASRGNLVNALQHVAGFLSRRLPPDDRRELGEAIEAYQSQDVPIIVPLTLMRHHLRRQPDAYLAQQVFLEKRPAGLDTRRR